MRRVRSDNEGSGEERGLKKGRKHLVWMVFAEYGTNKGAFTQLDTLQSILDIPKSSKAYSAFEPALHSCALGRTQRLE